MSKNSEKKPKKPIGICRCGHTGDAFDSQHADTSLENGHGPCLICDCPQFTWVGWQTKSKKGGK